MNRILSTGQGQGQVTKGHYGQKMHKSRMIHVLWVVSDVEIDGDGHFTI